MNEFLPYIVTIITAIISGTAAYFTATKKSKSDLAALRETNKAEIEKLMSQHKLDLEALERKHEMEIEKMKLEHEHKLELSQKEMEGNLGAGMMSSILSEAMKLPEVRQQIGQGIKQGKQKK